jgi:hypothetical protein
MIPVKDSTLAIVSLITGILSWIMLPFLGAIAAVVTGHIAKKEIRNSGGMITGNGMATAGLILGYVQLGFFVLAVCVITVLALMAPNMSDIFTNISSGLQS